MSSSMPIYVYETLEEPHRQFEVKQGMNEPALTKDPETGQPVRRVISGGYGILQKGESQGSRSGGGGCGHGCGCHS